MGGGSLAIVEKKPPLNAGGCAGGVLFHLLDWHRRLARKRRLFSPRRLLPSAARSSNTRRLLPAPPPSPAPLPPPPRPASGMAAAGPGVVARLMGLESWPADATVATPTPRPQKQRKVDAAPAPAPPAAVQEGAVSSVVVMLPPSRRPTAPAHPHPHAQAHAHARSHHSADLPARSPRRPRLVHAAAARLLDPGSSRGRGRLAYACSSPQHRGHAGGTLQDFLSRSDSLAAPPVDAERVGSSSRWQHMQHSVDTAMGGDAAAAGLVMGGSDTIVVPRTDFGDADTSVLDAVRKDYRSRNGGMGSCARVRSSSAGAVTRAGEQRLLRKRGTFSRPDAPRSAASGNLVSSRHPIGNAGGLAPGGGCSRRAARNSGPSRELVSSITPQRSTRRDGIDRSGLASTSRNASNASGPRRGSRKKIDRSTAGSNNREDRNAAAFASGSSTRPASRASSLGQVSEKRGFRSTQSDTSGTRMPAADPKCLEAEHRVAGGTSEKEEFSRLLKAKIDELGLSDKVAPSDAHSANLTVSLLQELIAALTDDTNTSASQCTSQCSNYSDSSAPLNNAGTVCKSNDQSPGFHKCYQFQGDQEADFSVTCTNDEPNQPSPTSVLEACFSNDASSLGSPVEKNEGKEFFVSMENKMEDLFNLDSDMVDLAMSIDTTKTDAHGSGEIPHVQSFAAQDFNFLEGRLHSIGEAIANTELLLDNSLFCGTPSTLSLHSFIVEMLETVEGCFCDGSESLGFEEENKYHRTNFLFDCIVESLDSRFRNFGKCGYKAWLRLPLTLSNDLLKRDVSEEISSWMDTVEVPPNRAAEKELDQVAAASRDACQVEAFNISVAIENDILEALVGEFASDQC
ncbi:translation initiation factor IF-2-like [Lolium rigidum]|uniref:translation initiation factor IF-2-like n=1 Tax=Lolium rigidum TaxID=89674 RepID=UPI001F5E09D6|nr:translation initiation factor IF-2-like [Lolium rigidum]